MSTREHPSRERVLDALRASGRALRLSEVCAQVSLSPNPVRSHLARLADDGLVRVDHEAPHGPGRPAALYSALPAEPEEGAAYRTLAGLLGRTLATVATPSVAGQAGRDWARTLLDRRRDAGRADVADAVDLVVELFDEGGFAPRVTPDRRTVELYRCPFISLAVEQPEVVCAVHLGLVRGVLDELDDPRTVRLAPVLDGSGPCLLHVAPTRTARPDLPEEAVS
jgi:predicted ArsR family transcriptional regulator